MTPKKQKNEQEKIKSRTPKNKKKANVKLILLIVLSVILVLLLALGAYAVYLLKFYKPENEATGTAPFNTDDYVHEPPKDWSTTGDTGETTNNPGTDEPVRDPIEAYNFILLGKDKVALNTDVIMLINLNVTTKKISVLQIPRDTYIEYEGYAGRINAVYAYYYNQGRNNKVKDPEAYGLDKLSTILEQTLCIHIHNYAMVNLEGFRNIVDILGGVELDVPADMIYEDPTQDLYINLKKGKQVLDGKKAEQFVRFRAGYVQADIGRLDAQKLFMSALLKEVKDHFNVTTIVRIANEVFKNLKSDIALDDLVYYAKCLMSINLNEMSFLSMPGVSARADVTSGAWYYIMNRKAMIVIIDRDFNIRHDMYINESIFDKNHSFSSRELHPHIDEYYLAIPASGASSSSSADDINKGSITIPRI